MAQSNPGPMELFLAQANQETTASPMDSENDDEDDEMDITFDDLLSPGQHPSSDLITKYLKGEMTFLQLQDAVRSKRRKEENVVSLETADQPLDIEKLTKMVQDMEQSQSGDSDAEPSAETSTTVGELPATPRKRRRRAKRTKLPKELQGLMGEANLKFARGETQEAIAMCNECIRQ
ncbi:uncharacterized protein LOC106151344, partial [Lingula anatina]|uniref:Uncharacterized protein LOC106151344 n=1 Tax=Lingula anatina TaxID=7574 RepID=A0A1S3H4F4_LINAN